MYFNKSYTCPPRFFKAPDFLMMAIFGIFGILLVTVPYAAKPVVQMAGMIGVLCAAIGVIRIRRQVVWPRQTLVIMAGLIFWVGGSALWSIAPGAALAGLPRLVFILGAGLALMVFARFGPPPTLWMFRVLILALLGGIAGVFLIQATDYGLFAWWHGVSGVEAHVTNKAVGVLALFSPAILYTVYQSGTRGGRRIAIFVLVALALMMMRSDGQSSLLALAVAGLALCMPVHSRLFFRTICAVIVLGVMLAPLLVVWAYNYAALFENWAILRAANAAQRIEVWQAIAQEIFKRPLFGYGYEATRYIPHFNSLELFQKGTTFSHPHNMALQLWIEFGVGGAACGAAALGFILGAIAREPVLSVRRLYFASFCAVLSVSLIGWGMWQGWWMTLIFLVIGINILAGRVLSGQKNPEIST